MRILILATILLALLIPIYGSSVSVPFDNPDTLSQQLFDTYIITSSKANANTVNSAIEIIADRGYNSGFWRNVFSEYKKFDHQTEINCVHILGKMLATDAIAYDRSMMSKEERDQFQNVTHVTLKPEVIDTILSRAKDTDDSFIRRFCLIALAQARNEKASNFMLQIIQDKDKFSYLDTFYAAVGLAQLGDGRGYEWLIANCDRTDDAIWGYRPLGSPSKNLNDCCVIALQTLTNKRELKTKIEWQQWWNQMEKKNIPKGIVVLLNY